MTDTGCTLRQCLEGTRLHSRSGAFEVRIGYQGGEAFSALVTDSRSGTHLHFPAADVLGAVPEAIDSDKAPGRTRGWLGWLWA